VTRLRGKQKKTVIICLPLSSEQTKFEDGDNRLSSKASREDSIDLKVRGVGSQNCEPSAANRPSEKRHCKYGMKKCNSEGLRQDDRVLLYDSPGVRSCSAKAVKNARVFEAYSS